MIQILGHTERFTILFHQQFNTVILMVVISPHTIKAEAKTVQALCLFRPQRFCFYFRQLIQLSEITQHNNMKPAIQFCEITFLNSMRPQNKGPFLHSLNKTNPELSSHRVASDWTCLIRNNPLAAESPDRLIEPKYKGAFNLRPHAVLGRWFHKIG